MRLSSGGGGGILTSTHCNRSYDSAAALNCELPLTEGRYDKRLFCKHSCCAARGRTPIANQSGIDRVIPCHLTRN